MRIMIDLTHAGANSVEVFTGMEGLVCNADIGFVSKVMELANIQAVNFTVNPELSAGIPEQESCLDY